MSFVKGNEFHAINSYFIGPKAANLPDFRANVNIVLGELLETRQRYFPNDADYPPKGVRESLPFQQVRDNFSNAIQQVARMLGDRSIPFWSPRYEAHMCADLTMPSMLGYFMTMLYNPNNVALETSPCTTVAEQRAGKQLSELFGYNTDERKKNLPLAWGHLTADGTIANLESIWVARNLKFYPLSLFQAVKEGKLKFIADTFEVENCKGDLRLFKDMSTWELLNLRPETILELPEALKQQFNISDQFLEEALKEYSIQTAGKDALEKYHGIDKPAQYMIGKTHHYSWPKGAALMGLGSGNMTEIDVDLDACIDTTLLQEKLHECAREGQGVYAVVAIVGSTEEGAVERLSEILELRKKFQKDYGLSFLVHADAAWGGYFATMLERDMLSAYWATIETEDFICVPFNRLGPERMGYGFRSKEVEEEKQWFRDNVLEKENKDITAEAMDRLRELGSDLNINAFALNWKHKGSRSQNGQLQEGELNRNMEEANYLMKRVVEKFSVTTGETNKTDIPLFLTSTKFKPELYGKCAQVFMDRLGLDRSHQDLFVLRNVVMSPLPTKKDFIAGLMRTFEEVTNEEVKFCRDRNKRGNRQVQFLMQGTDEVFLVLQGSFHIAPLRQQLILTAELDSNLQQHYAELRNRYPRDAIILESLDEIALEDKVENLAHDRTQDFQGRIHRKGHVNNESQGVVRLTRIIKSRPINSSSHDPTYPQQYMPFYLYGSAKEKHISHMLLRAPNIALSASNVALSPELDQAIRPHLPEGLILTLSSIPEVSVQPCMIKNQDIPPYFFFQRKKQFKVTVWRDPRSPIAEGPGLLEGLRNPIGSGTMTLGNHVDVDAEEVNHNPADCLRIDPTPWQDFDRIGDILDGTYDCP
ncbi:L-2,4-diaminobutyrate decarboxylase [Aspergillus udagawae]|uniref:L-2,4-diaminobutyrate decarboxylase n=1 Tax=Aspergillus udagawae TaxID=91492 RepID=A0A8H3SBW9_9EURO|nr:L-2,4-diaminobutyrate decarboxylase [Aspergillus udagawae]